MRRSNSVESLSPKSRFLDAMNTIPMTPDVRYNTIIGDRGRGDSPNSSDGVVPYWSSHMNGAESECMALVRRIRLQVIRPLLSNSNSCKKNSSLPCRCSSTQLYASCELIGCSGLLWETVLQRVLGWC